MEAEKGGRAAALKAALYEIAPEKLHLTCETLAKRLDEAGFFEAAECMALHKNTLCTDTCALCKPIMDAFSPEPKEGWLHCCYHFLRDRLYPDPSGESTLSGVRAALEFYLAVLHVLSIFEAEARPYDPLTDILFLPKDVIDHSQSGAEYEKLTEVFEMYHIIPLMRIGRECMPFDPLAHTSGVHHVASHIALEAAKHHLPVDVALVAGSAMAHDVGKFGCIGDDAKRIPYLHYYYTDLFLRRNGMPAMAHTASNHSTWDLEFENLPIESLTLIYADFLVRGSRDESGREVMGIHTLSEAQDLIFCKLSDMTEEKRKRYLRVYYKLCDFERYLVSAGVAVDPFSSGVTVGPERNAALLSDAEADRRIRRMAMGFNIRLMDSIGSAASLERLLETARSEKNLDSIRTYLFLLEEYCTYMKRGQKLQTLAFLYELLMHHESDVRRRAGLLMGRILANSGLQYRKELPIDAPEDTAAPTLSEMLRECSALFDSYVEKLLFPEHKITKKHALRISNSLKVVVGSVFAHCKHVDARMYLNRFLGWFVKGRDADPFVMLDSLCHVPVELFSKEELHQLVSYAMLPLRGGNTENRVIALRALLYLANGRGEDVGAEIASVVSRIPLSDCPAAEYLSRKLIYVCGGAGERPLPLTDHDVSELFLENLKTAVHWTVKLINIDRLQQYAIENPFDAFHVATHFANLLLVSEHLPVREHAGKALTALAQSLSIDQLNELVIDLCRGLENGQSEFTGYVPPYLGRLIRLLPGSERLETVDYLEHMVRSANASAARSALMTLGAVLTSGLMQELDKTDTLDQGDERIVGVLFAGLAHFHPSTHRIALMVLARNVFSCEVIPLSRRRKLYFRVVKKLCASLNERRMDDITFFNATAMLNHLYRMSIDVQVTFGEAVSDNRKPVAFFPGAFDPFSSGHKRIVDEILAIGAEVYLAVDEFSWSKRTQPKLLRRRIVSMSVADRFDTYLFPDEIPVNLANPADLACLSDLFPGRRLYIVAGSDVIEHASAYSNPDLAGSVATFDHILFSRNHADGQRPAALERLTGHVIELTLPTYFEDVSSTRIREYIDKNLEISMLVDPVVEAFIYEYGLYIRTPQYKETISPTQPLFTIATHWGNTCVSLLSALPAEGTTLAHAALTEHADAGTVCFLLGGDKAPARGMIAAHTVSTGELFRTLDSVVTAEHVRDRASGRILFIDGASVLSGGALPLERLAGELLVNSLSTEHTYAIYRAKSDRDPLTAVLLRKGFMPVHPSEPNVLIVDMRAPLVLIRDVFLSIKSPLREDPAVISTVVRTRSRIERALTKLYPGTLVLSFDAEAINHALTRKVQSYNGVLGLPEKPRKLGKHMCVPYGKILSDVVVPNTVTKTLHVEKVFKPDINGFSIMEYPNYSPLPTQIRTIKSFDRPVLLVDDLLHKGYRMEKLDPLFKAADVDVEKIIVGIMSGRGKDLMDMQCRSVDAVYLIPNMRYWFTESLLYPFIGGDSVEREDHVLGRRLPSINLIMPYKTPDYIRGTSEEAVRQLSMAALYNTRDILRILEERHQAMFARSLTLARLGEALYRPLRPDCGKCFSYDMSLPASVYIADDIERMHRLGCKEEEL